MSLRFSSSRYLSLRLIVVLCFAAAGVAAAEPGLQIYFVDVEGGAATLIVTPAGESILMDAGWPRDDQRDPKRIVKAMGELGIKRIDHLLVSHYHTDHWGGVPALAKMVPIGRFYDHGHMTELKEDKNFAQRNEAYMAAGGARSQTLKPGDTIALRSAKGAAPVRLRIVAANGETARGSGTNPDCATATMLDPDPTDNARSVGFVLEMGPFRFLDLGDLTWNIEHKLACPAPVVGPVTLYQVTHHGMNTSNNPVLVRSVKPQVAVFNNGPRKGGSPEVVTLLRGVPGIEDIYQGHRNTATSDADNSAPELTANLTSEAECQGHSIRVAVKPDGKSFTVTNGRTGQSKTYKTRA